MATYKKTTLSGAANGLPILIVATATLGTTIHTAIAGTVSFDVIELYATNNDTVERTLTIEWGSATATNSITLTIPSKEGLTYSIPNLILQNSLVVTAFASVASVIAVFGSVNRIS